MPEHGGAPTDDDLIRAIRDGSAAPDGWRTLLGRHQPRLLAVCTAMVGRDAAADVCQSALLNIVRGLAGFDFQSGFGTWSTRITINACLSYRRSEKIRRTESLSPYSPSDAEPGPPEPGAASRGPRGDWRPVEPGAEERIQSSELSGLLTRALATLDAERRAILVLRDVRGLDYSQIASVLGLAEGTVKSRLFRAREALKTAVEQLASETTTPGNADPD